jgi:hypothetical protein
MLTGSASMCVTCQEPACVAPDGRLPHADRAQVVRKSALEAAGERLRDVKKPVRREAASHLMAVFRRAPAFNILHAR